MAERSFSLAARLFVAYAAFVALGGWFVAREIVHEVKPAVRQSTEETLVDTANLLAEVVADDVISGTLGDGRFAELLQDYGKRRPNAEIWGVEKVGVSHRIYVVDARGIVLLDSTGKDVGRDYSRWRDVYLTLRGKYGARSTEAIPGDESSTVMYVAAPIVHGGRIVGAVTVAKPNHTVQPFIERSRRRLLLLGLAFVALGLLFGAALSFWLARSVRRLTDYAKAVSAGERAEVPVLPGGELAELATSLEHMRSELDGRAYVERYAQTLTHELKSPLSAIRGAAELLRGDIPSDARQRFLTNIEAESSRLEALAERLLCLAQVEKRRGLEEREPLALTTLAAETIERRQPLAASRHVRLSLTGTLGLTALGERFLVVQALENLVDNALDFSADGATITVTARVTGESEVALEVENDGPAIPDFALARVTERFYSLPRPGSGRKSTGLGLSFVREVAELHRGSLELTNTERGVRATLRLPRA